MKSPLRRNIGEHTGWSTRDRSHIR
jgi:hypothetical protein